MDHDETSSMWTISLDGTQQQQIHLLNHHNVVMKNVSCGNMPVQYWKFTAQMEQSDNEFQQSISKSVLGSTDYATGSTEKLYPLDITKFSYKLDHGQELSLLLSFK